MFQKGTFILPVLDCRHMVVTWKRKKICNKKKIQKWHLVCRETLKYVFYYHYYIVLERGIEIRVWTAWIWRRERDQTEWYRVECYCPFHHQRTVPLENLRSNCIVRRFWGAFRTMCIDVCDIYYYYYYSPLGPGKQLVYTGAQDNILYLFLVVYPRITEVSCKAFEYMIMKTFVVGSTRNIQVTLLVSVPSGLSLLEIYILNVVHFIFSDTNEISCLRTYTRPILLACS